MKTSKGKGLGKSKGKKSIDSSLNKSKNYEASALSLAQFKVKSFSLVFLDILSIIPIVESTLIFQE